MSTAYQLISNALKHAALYGRHDANAYVHTHAAKLESDLIALAATEATPDAPVNRAVNPFAAFIDALRADREMQWGYHCNVAMAAFDKGVPAIQANQAAALFMERLLGEYTPLHDVMEHAAPTVEEGSLSYRINTFVAQWIGSVARPDAEIAPTTEWPKLLHEIDTLTAQRDAALLPYTLATKEGQGLLAVGEELTKRQAQIDELIAQRREREAAPTDWTDAQIAAFLAALRGNTLDSALPWTKNDFELVRAGLTAALGVSP